MMQTIDIRKALPPDATTIRALALKIWPHAYGEILSTEQLQYMLDLLYNESTLQEQMVNGIDFIIVNDGAADVGFASWSMVEDGVYKLHKIYVLPSQQGKGTGRRMIGYVINDITAKNADTLLLNVNRHNQAKLFYEKLGFTVLKEEDIDIGRGYFMNDYVMKLKLRL